jgi:hypothetical protein
MPDPNTNAGLRTFTAVAVATLPVATSVPIGTRAFVSDNDVNNQIGRGKTVAGGGTYQAKIISNGAVWKVM